MPQNRRTIHMHAKDFLTDWYLCRLRLKIVQGPDRLQQESCCRFLSASPHQSVISCSTWILRIITSSPIVTIISSANPNQPNTIAVTPTPLLTLPFAKSCAIMLAATDAVCCHNTDTSTKIE